MALADDPYCWRDMVWQPRGDKHHTQAIFSQTGYNAKTRNNSLSFYTLCKHKDECDSVTHYDYK